MKSSIRFTWFVIVSLFTFMLIWNWLIPTTGIGWGIFWMWIAGIEISLLTGIMFAWSYEIIRIGIAGMFLTDMKGAFRYA